MFESSNRRQFQKGLDAEKQRAIRRDTSLSLRRKQREAHLQKKFRRITQKPSFNTSTSTSPDGEPEPAPLLTDIPKFCGNVMSDNIELQLIGTTALRKLLSIERDPPTQRVVKSGVIPKIIQFMFGDQTKKANRNQSNSRHQDIWNQLQFESAWVVTNIAAASSELTRYLCQHGAIEGFVHLFRNAAKEEIADQAFWGLGNIAGDGLELRNQILQSGVVHDIMDQIQNLGLETQRNAVWTISNLYRYNKPLKVQDIHFVVPVLTKLLRESQDICIKRDILWTFSYLSVNQGDGIIAYLVNECGVVADCMKVLSSEQGKYEIALNQLQSEQRKQMQRHSYFGTNGGAQNQEISKRNDLFNITKAAMLRMSDEIYRPCLRFIGNVLSETDDMTQAVLDAGYLDIIEPWANHFLPQQRKEIMWAFSNILAGSHQQIEALLSRPKLLKSIMDAGTCGKMAVKREAVWCICNAITEAISEQKKLLAENGAIEVLCSMLKPDNVLSEMQLQVILEGLDGFLSVYANNTINPYADQVEELHGLDYLEERQGDENLSEPSYMMIVDLMKRYWENEGVEGEGNNMFGCLEDKLGADVDQKTNQFAFGMAKSNDYGHQNVVNQFGGNNNMFQF